MVVSSPRWFNGNDIFTRWNPDVVGELSSSPPAGGWLTRLVRLRLLGKSPANAYLRLNQSLWRYLPASFASSTPVHWYAAFLQRLARMHHVRAQALSTFFLRNRPELELIRRLAARKGATEKLTVTVLGCSTGAEVYSVASTIQSAMPELRLTLHAVDISKEAVEFAKRGQYSVTKTELTDTPIFDRMTPAEMEQVFEIDGDVATVKPRIKEGIELACRRCRDAGSSRCPGTPGYGQ